MLTVLRNRFCSKTRSSSNHQPDVVDMISIDQSKASTSSTSRPATIHVKKNGEKSMTSSKYQKVELKDYSEVSFETRKGKQNKRDLETQHNWRKSSTTSTDSVTPREQYISTSSIPTFEAWFLKKIDVRSFTAKANFSQALLEINVKWRRNWRMGIVVPTLSGCICVKYHCK